MNSRGCVANISRGRYLLVILFIMRLHVCSCLWPRVVVIVLNSLYVDVGLLTFFVTCTLQPALDNWISWACNLHYLYGRAHTHDITR